MVAQTFVRGCLNVLIVVAAFRLLHAGASGVGHMTAAIGVGGLLGALGAMTLSGGRLAGSFAFSLVFWGVPIALIAPRPYLAAALVLLAVVGRQQRRGRRGVHARAGDTGDRFYIVRDGEFDVAIGDLHKTARATDYFGEIALLRDVPRDGDRHCEGRLPAVRPPTRRLPCCRHRTLRGAHRRAGRGRRATVTAPRREPRDAAMTRYLPHDGAGALWRVRRPPRPPESLESTTRRKFNQRKPLSRAGRLHQRSSS
jgi:hypothetical protein